MRLHCRRAHEDSNAEPVSTTASCLATPSRARGPGASPSGSFSLYVLAAPVSLGERPAGRHRYRERSRRGVPRRPARPRSRPTPAFASMASGSRSPPSPASPSSASSSSLPLPAGLVRAVSPASAEAWERGRAGPRRVRTPGPSRAGSASMPVGDGRGGPPRPRLRRALPRRRPCSSTGGRARRLFGAVVLASGLVQVAVAIATDDRTLRLHGSFVNPNHFAGYLEIALAFALGLLWYRTRTGIAGTSRRPTGRGEVRAPRSASCPSPSPSSSSASSPPASSSASRAAASSPRAAARSSSSPSPYELRRRRLPRAPRRGRLARGPRSSSAPPSPSRARAPSPSSASCCPTPPTSPPTTGSSSGRTPSTPSDALPVARLGPRHVPRGDPARPVPRRRRGSSTRRTTSTCSSSSPAASREPLLGADRPRLRPPRAPGGPSRQKHREESAFGLAGFGALVMLLLHGVAEFNFSIPAMPATLAACLGGAWAALSWHRSDEPGAGVIPMEERPSRPRSRRAVGLTRAPSDGPERERPQPAEPGERERKLRLARPLDPHHVLAPAVPAPPGERRPFGPHGQVEPTRPPRPGVDAEVDSRPRWRATPRRRGLGYAARRSASRAAASAPRSRARATSRLTSSDVAPREVEARHLRRAPPPPRPAPVLQLPAHLLDKYGVHSEAPTVSACVDVPPAELVVRVKVQQRLHAVGHARQPARPPSPGRSPLPVGAGSTGTTGRGWRAASVRHVAGAAVSDRPQYDPRLLPPLDVVEEVDGCLPRNSYAAATARSAR